MDPGSTHPTVGIRGMVVRITFHPGIRGNNSITVGIVGLQGRQVDQDQVILDPHPKEWVPLVLKVRGLNITLPRGREVLRHILNK